MQPFRMSSAWYLVLVFRPYVAQSSLDIAGTWHSQSNALLVTRQQCVCDLIDLQGSTSRGYCSTENCLYERCSSMLRRRMALDRRRSTVLAMCSHECRFAPCCWVYEISSMTQIRGVQRAHTCNTGGSFGWLRATLSSLYVCG